MFINYKIWTNSLVDLFIGFYRKTIHMKLCCFHSVLFHVRCTKIIDMRYHKLPDWTETVRNEPILSGTDIDNIKATVQLSRCFERTRICALRMVARRGLSLLASDSRVTRKLREILRDHLANAQNHLLNARRESDTIQFKQSCS